jgi:DnaJ-class molecular chaperone
MASRQKSKVIFSISFRKSSINFHLFSNKEEAEIQFKLVSEAYEVLSNENSRRMYDRYGSKGVQNDHERFNPGFRFHRPEDIFKEFFGNDFGVGSMNSMGSFGSFGSMGSRSLFDDFFGNDPFFSQSSSNTFSSNIQTMSNSFHTSSSSSNSTSKSVKTTIINGKKTTTTTIKDNTGKITEEITITYPDGRIEKSTKVNGLLTQ